MNAQRRRLRATESNLDKDTKPLLLETVYDKGFQYERSRRGCAQCTVAVMCEVFGVDPAVFKAASAMSGGMARSGLGPCGAFTGGLLVISYFFGRPLDRFGEPGSAFRDRALALEYRSRFAEKYGGWFCKDVQKAVFGRSFDLSSEEGYQAFEEAGAHVDKCPSVVGTAVSWLAEILLREGVTPRKLEK